MAVRECALCHQRMAPYVPRKRVDGLYLCPACAQRPRGGMVSANLEPRRVVEGTIMAKVSGLRDCPHCVGIQRVAHDSGDGQTIFHCPFCGSGQVIARSDRTIECEFCHTCFTVQVQPQFAAFPQTVDGMPITQPGMPGLSGIDPSSASDGAPVDPSQIDPSGGVPGEMAPGDPSEADARADEGNQEEEAGQDNDNPFTASLSPFDAAARQLIMSAPVRDRRKVAAFIKSQRGQ